MTVRLALTMGFSGADLVNIRRGTAAAYWKNKTHCPQGHPYDEQNTYTYQNRRSCRLCAKTSARRRAEQRSLAKLKEQNYGY